MPNAEEPWCVIGFSTEDGQYDRLMSDEVDELTLHNMCEYLSVNSHIPDSNHDAPPLLRHYFRQCSGHLTH